MFMARFYSPVDSTHIQCTTDHYQYILDLSKIDSNFKADFFDSITSEAHIQILDMSLNKLPRIVKVLNVLSMTGYIKFDAPTDAVNGVSFYLVGDTRLSESDSILASTNTLLYDWSFDDVSSPAIDDCQNGNLTVTGTAPWNAPSSILGGAFILDNVNLTTITNANNILHIGKEQPFSILVWVKADNVSSYNMRLLNKEESSPIDKGIDLAILTTRHPYLALGADFGSGDRIAIIGNGITLDTNWHNLIFTYDGSGSASGLNIYCDGTIVTSTRYGTTLIGDFLNNATLVIGNTINSIFAYKGLVDQYRIAYHELTALEVSQRYNNIHTSDFWLYASINPAVLNINTPKIHTSIIGKGRINCTLNCTLPTVNTHINSTVIAVGIVNIQMPKTSINISGKNINNCVLNCRFGSANISLHTKSIYHGTIATHLSGCTIALSSKQYYFATVNCNLSATNVRLYANCFDAQLNITLGKLSIRCITHQTYKATLNIHLPALTVHNDEIEKSKNKLQYKYGFYY